MRGPLARLSLCPLPLIIALMWAGAVTADEPLWVGRDPSGSPQVHLYFFWSAQCPHCREARPFVEELASRHPWLVLHAHELTTDPARGAQYRALAAALGEEARYVPAFFVCGRMLVGYDTPEGRGAELLVLAEGCRAPPPVSGAPEAVAPPPTETLSLPLLGEVDPKALGLPLFTLVVAGLDAFNPCAFFVLLFLLSLMVHARSRARMLLVGGTFVLISGLVYFLFMAAWLNLFLVIGATPWVTAGAGLLALVIGVLNVKDFFAFHRGPTLSIPEAAKPGLFRRMRGLLAADRLGTMLLGTVALAIAANSYELLCTAGFPLVYTRALTLNGLGLSQYYAYLALYNLVYVLPLLVIVGLFGLTLGAHKLSERQGRALKLLSGLMMLGLGVLLLVRPELLTELWVGAVLLGLALALTALAHWLGAGRGRSATS